MTERYMSVADVAEYLGVKNASSKAVGLPEPDVVIGRTRGWRKETIDIWNASRPGRGVGGGRPRKAQK